MCGRRIGYPPGGRLSGFRPDIRPDPTSSSSAASGDYGGYLTAARLTDKLVRGESFERAYLEWVLARVERRQGILDLVDRPWAKRATESRLTGAWSRCRAKFLTRDH